MLRKWADLQENLIHIGAIHALDLRTEPENCLRKALVLNLTPVFDPKTRIRDDPAIRRSFDVVSTYVSPIDTLAKQSPAHKEAVQAALEESKRMREMGTCIGLVVTVVAAPDFGIYLSKTIAATPGIIQAAWNLEYCNGKDNWQKMFTGLLALGVASEGFTMPIGEVEDDER
ncbi:hypothetical protein EST38_g5771 [Candolleomyces aberdarensis]|uniref:Uncharacterized protein n=1 Tax=Candolleomyces aberdarensis TaxID=2316362 RepID=A0A4Q2DMB1_9AGAR|nr:hypothetical protein EST38_g5771 [Candolleomyces aberdarensis]